MTWAVYTYHPLSMQSLWRVIEHDALGQTAKWQRYVADLLHTIAAGKRIDDNRTPRFGEILKEIYRDPFIARRNQPETAREIISYISERVKELIDGAA